MNEEGEHLRLVMASVFLPKCLEKSGYFFRNWRQESRGRSDPNHCPY